MRTLELIGVGHTSLFFFLITDFSDSSVVGWFRIYSCGVCFSSPFKTIEGLCCICTMVLIRLCAVVRLGCWVFKR